MIKLDNLDRWSRLPKGGVLELLGSAARRIRLNVNAPGRVSLFVADGDGELRFLAAPEGRDVVEFTMAGDVRITTDDDDVFVYSAETEPTFAVIENAEIFTKIAQRKARNPELEQMLYLQEVNMQRRFDALAHRMNEKVREAYDAGQQSIVTSNAPGTVADQPVGVGSGPAADGGASGEADEPAQSAAS